MLLQQYYTFAVCARSLHVCDLHHSACMDFQGTSCMRSDRSRVTTVTASCIVLLRTHTSWYCLLIAASIEVGNTVPVVEGHVSVGESPVVQYVYSDEETAALIILNNNLRLVTSPVTLVSLLVRYPHKVIAVVRV
jgi:hypothetical protein